jgi:hypothetical protein
MSAVKTLQIRIVNPMAERLIDDLASQNMIEIDEPETTCEETPREWFRRWSREVTEWQRQEGLLDEEPLSMEEIVAICKEARAERYERNQKNAACH